MAYNNNHMHHSNPETHVPLFGKSQLEKDIEEAKAVGADVRESLRKSKEENAEPEKLSDVLMGEEFNKKIADKAYDNLLRSMKAKSIECAI